VSTIDELCKCFARITEKEMVRADGIEPSTPAWKAGVLPLNYARLRGTKIKPKYARPVKGNKVPLSL
jgi:hypothetical protein